MHGVDKNPWTTWQWFQRPRAASRPGRKHTILELEPLEMRVVPSAVTIHPVQDNTIYQESGSLSNGLGPTLFVGETNMAQARRALIQFDVAGSVPAGSTINSVSLTLTAVQSGPIGAPSPVNLQRVSAAWGEGTSYASNGQGAPATTNDATWTFRFFNTQNWTNPGGDFSSTVSGSAAVGAPGIYTWNSTAQMVSDVQGWLNNPSSNFGWEVIGDEAAVGTTKVFDSKDLSTASGRPALTINFTASTILPIAITSAASTTFTVGTAGQFNVTATGMPNPTLTEIGARPAGITFTDNGNGTATLAGVAPPATAGTYHLTITAANGVADPVSQNFTLTIQPPVWTPLPGHVFVTAADAGGDPKVKVFDAASGAAIDDFFAYDAHMKSGVRVAAADLQGDGTPDIIAVPGPGAGSVVRVFDGRTGQMRLQFAAFTINGQLFSGGQFVAAADILGQGYDDIIISADAGGGPAVGVFDGKTGQQVLLYFAFPASPSGAVFTGGVRVAAGPYAPNGPAVIYTAAGPGGGPAVSVWSAADIAANQPEKTFYVLPPDAQGNLFTGGVYLGATFVSSLGRDYLVSGAAPGGGPAVTLIDPLNTTTGIGAFVGQPFYAFDPSFTGGVRVAGGTDVVLAGPGRGTAAIAKSFALSGTPLVTLDGSDADNPNFMGGLFVAAV